MHPLETYLGELSQIHNSGAGVRETSYYRPLAALLDEVGKTLKPKVKCILTLRNVGAGIPDVGLFSADQLRGLPESADPLTGGLPARAVLEVKGLAANLDVTLASEQVARYLAQYGLVMVTNYRAFRLIGRGRDGQAREWERYELADSEASFWALAAHPRQAANAQGQTLTDFLLRAMTISAPLSTPKDLAWFLASYARDALARLQGADLPALTNLRAALEEALGLSFEGQKGDHFFRSSLVQTLFYGIFSAWVLWHENHPGDEEQFDWRKTAWYLRVPVIQALFGQVADPGRLRALNLVEVLDWAGDTLNRVDRAAFFNAFETGHAVQYFYEPFLHAYDPDLRKQLGVWYTPPEIVKYMVERVDTVLREELDIASGLADPRVVVLDPCAGTGAYLVEVLRRIADTLREQGEGALLAGAIRTAATERVFGFEILTAPFVVAHLQLGLLLQHLGAPLAEDQRAGMFLTNALTGWEPPTEPKTQLPLFEQLAQERDAAEKVKRETPVLVVIGNPPYNSFAGVSPAEEQGLVDPYKRGLISEWGIKKFNLDDLYVRFFRLAERRIAEQTGKGVVCYISNFSYLSDPSFVVMRQRLLTEFDALWFDCLNGDSRETGKLTPEGAPDPSVFSTPFNREGIRVGTTVGLMVRKSQRSGRSSVRFRHFWGVKKRHDLVARLSDPDPQSHYKVAAPERQNRYTFRPDETSAEYRSWPMLTDLCAAPPSNGLMEKRRGALIDIDRAALERRIKAYYDPAVTWDALRQFGSGLTDDAARFNAGRARAKVMAAESFQLGNVVRYGLRPLDSRWCYYSSTRPLWNEPRPALRAQAAQGNAFLMTRPAGAASPEGVPFCFTKLLGDNDFLRGHAYYLPLRLRSTTLAPSAGGSRMFVETLAVSANLSTVARSYLASLGLTDLDTDEETACLIWLHALAVGYAPAYLTENADGIRQDWPRVPLPADRALLLASAALGRQIAALLDTEAPVIGVTSGAIRSELRQIAVVEGPTPLNLAVTAGWGHAGKDGVTMPGSGRRVERHVSAEERVPGLGDLTHDVYLNEASYWRNIPDRVWKYTIGGYQVMKKWLSYREKNLLGRAITDDEAREVRDTARRLTAIVLLEPALNANYAEVKANTYPWPATPETG